ncbi:MAG TPA: tetratricopeptide repeat protein, partial [bacterium]|nr:tetratricopeptide repeat protein [bacterium]
DYPPAISNIGTAYFLAGDATRAEAFLLRAVQLAPNHASYRAALADIYTSQGRLSAAEEQLLKAQQIAPNNRDIQNRLLWLRRQQGDILNGDCFLNMSPATRGTASRNRMFVLKELEDDRSGAPRLITASSVT